MSTALSPAKGRVATSRPPIPSGRPLEDRWFTDETVPGARDGTIVDQVWFNTVSAILRAVIRAGGVTPDDANSDMLLQAISALALGEAEGMAIDASRITSGQLDPARIPVLAADTVVISSGDLTALTAPQQAAIATGTIVATTDGQRWIYKGTGSKTDSASYITLADVTPDWSMITGKPTNADYRVFTAPLLKTINATVTVAANETGSILRIIATSPVTVTVQSSSTGPGVFYVVNLSNVSHTLQQTTSNWIWANGAGAPTYAIPPYASGVLVGAGTDWHFIENRKTGTAAGNLVSLDASGRLPAVDGSQLTGLGTSWPDGVLKGLELSAATTTTVGIAVGSCRNEDAGTPRSMVLASGITKGFGAWTAGTGNGGLDTGSIAASTWYHIHLIRKDSDGSIDALLSLSATAPAMPSGYTARRRVGAIRTNGSTQVTPFLQVGDEFTWTVPVMDRNGNSASGATSVTITVPAGVRVKARLRGAVETTTSNFVTMSVYSPEITDQTAMAGNANSASLVIPVAGMPATNGTWGAAAFDVMTNTSSQVRVAVTSSSTAGIVALQTDGWIDTRGRI